MSSEDQCTIIVALYWDFCLVLGNASQVRVSSSLLFPVFDQLISSYEVKPPPFAAEVKITVHTGKACVWPVH